jgi:hypothetical protein
MNGETTSPLSNRLEQAATELTQALIEWRDLMAHAREEIGLPELTASQQRTIDLLREAAAALRQPAGDTLTESGWALRQKDSWTFITYNGVPVIEADQAAAERTRDWRADGVDYESVYLTRTITVTLDPERQEP